MTTIVLAGCGGGSSSNDAPASDAEGSTATGTEATDALPLDQDLLDRADAVEQVTTSNGGVVVVAVECASQMGGNLVHVGVDGLPAGTYTGSFEPSAGGDLTVKVTTEGPARGARQATLDEAEYTITFPDMDGGVSLIIPGCPG
ncbi:MAG: hypothetical protein PVJ02_13385 [Gemmatimonadota bacterium]|jgi:hypothetical protein